MGNKDSDQTGLIDLCLRLVHRLFCEICLVTAQLTMPSFCVFDLDFMKELKAVLCFKDLSQQYLVFKVLIFPPQF